MPRVVVGTWVLVLVAVAFITGTSILQPGQAGAAVRSGPPSPPAVGLCVADFLDPDLVACDRPHLGEIVKSWTGTVSQSPPGSGTYVVDPQGTDGGYLTSEATDQVCSGDSVDHLGPSDPLVLSDLEWWLPQPPTSQTVVHGPGEDFLPGWSWSACVVIALDQSGTMTNGSVSLRGAADPFGPWPTVWRSCGGDTSVAMLPIPCDRPHRVEFLGSTMVPLTPDEVDALLAAAGAPPLDDLENPYGFDWVDLSDTRLAHPVAEQSCRELAARAIGAPLESHPSLHPVLVPAGLSQQWQDDGTGRFVEGWVDGVHVDCVVEVVGDRLLDGSVFGVGTGPLPLG